MKVKVNIINTLPIPCLRQWVTVTSMMMTSFAFEESLVRDTHTDFCLIYLKLFQSHLKLWKQSQKQKGNHHSSSDKPTAINTISVQAATTRSAGHGKMELTLYLNANAHADNSVDRGLSYAATTSLRSLCRWERASEVLKPSWSDPDGTSIPCADHETKILQYQYTSTRLIPTNLHYSL